MIEEVHVPRRIVKNLKIKPITTKSHEHDSGRVVEVNTEKGMKQPPRAAGVASQILFTHSLLCND